jgi:hypothetical protein
VVRLRARAPSPLLLESEMSTRCGSLRELLLVPTEANPDSDNKVRVMDALYQWSLRSLSLRVYSGRTGRF